MLYCWKNLVFWSLFSPVILFCLDLFFVRAFLILCYLDFGWFESGPSLFSADGVWRKSSHVLSFQTLTVRRVLKGSRNPGIRSSRKSFPLSSSYGLDVFSRTVRCCFHKEHLTYHNLRDTGIHQTKVVLLAHRLDFGVGRGIPWLGGVDREVACRRDHSGENDRAYQSEDRVQGVGRGAFGCAKNPWWARNAPCNITRFRTCRTDHPSLTGCRMLHMWSSRCETNNGELSWLDLERNRVMNFFFLEEKYLYLLFMLNKWYGRKNNSDILHSHTHSHSNLKAFAHCFVYLILFTKIKHLCVIFIFEKRNTWSLNFHQAMRTLTVIRINSVKK